MLGDRLVSVTLARMWAALSAWQKVRFVGELLLTGFSVPGDEIEQLSNIEVRWMAAPGACSNARAGLLLCSLTV